MPYKSMSLKEKPNTLLFNTIIRETRTNVRNRYFKKVIFHPPRMINFSNFFVTVPKTFQLSLGVAGKEILTLSALSLSCQFLPLSDRTIYQK